MADLLFIKQVDIKLFFKRRLSRIFPTMALFVIVMAIFFAVRTGSLPGAEDFFSTLFFLRTYFPSDSNILTSAWQIGNLWSLNVEEHSYIYLAIIAIIGRRYLGPTIQNILLALTVVVIFFLVLYYQSNPPAGASPWFSRSETACLGLIAAATLRVMRNKFSLKVGLLGPSLSIGLLTLAIACHAKYQYRGFEHNIAPVALAIAINYLEYAPRFFLSFLSMAPLRWFGRCSFSIYLWQQPFYAALIGYQISNLMGLVAGIAVGAASFYIFEDPIRKRINSSPIFENSLTTDNPPARTA